MAQHYTLTTKGTAPVKIEDVKTHLKIETDADDVFLKPLIRTASEFAEKYIGRDLRVNTWTLLIDKFEARICLLRDPVASITSVKHLVATVLTTVANTVYYLKKGIHRSEILLIDGQEWPTNTDTREHAIEIEFVTEAHPCLEQAKAGIMRHVAFLYENRGDCDAAESVKKSGASALYDQFRIPRS